MDREKVMKGLEACSIGLYCPEDECPYAEDKIEIEENCIAALARDALELLKAQEPGWISVKDRLPETDEGYYSMKTYIVSTVHGSVLAMKYVSKTIRGKQVKRWEWNDRISPWEVTHWMELPAPPKEE